MPRAGLFSWAIGLIAFFIIIWSLRDAPHPAQTPTPPRVVFEAVSAPAIALAVRKQPC